MIEPQDSLTQSTKPRHWTTQLLVWSYRFVAVVSILFLFAVLTLKFTPVGTAVVGYLMESTPLAELPEADAIVVLGGDAFRVADALRVYRAGKAPIIIVSGESEQALQFLDAGEVPECDVYVDRAPGRTIDHPRTIQAVPEIDESSRIILVSSALHQRRALDVFRRAGYKHVWVCSMEWELYSAMEHRKVSHDQVAQILYELGARVKSWFVD